MTRQQEVWALIAKGKLDKEIAYELDICVRTVRHYAEDIKRGMNVRQSRIGRVDVALAWYRKEGLLNA